MEESSKFDAFKENGQISDALSDRERLKQELEIKEKHLKLLQQSGIRVAEFLDHTLEQVISVTNSKLGYIFLYDEEKQEFTLHSWSEAVMEECKIKDQSRLYRLGNVGLWGEVVRKKTPVIVNDYQAPHAMKKGYPEGHVQILNFISIPVFYEDRIVAVVGAANKASDYDGYDVLNLNLLMNTVWPVVELRKEQEKVFERGELLKKERELFSATLFSIEEGIIACDIYGKTILMNRMAEKYTGWSKEDAYGEDIEKIFHNINLATRENLQNPVRYVLETGNSIESIKNEGLLSKDGTEIYVSGRAARIVSETGRITGVVVSFRDITKEYEQENEIEAFLDINLDMLCVTDTDGKFHKVNKMFQEVLGYETEELEGKEYLSFIHEDDIEATLQAVANLAEKKSVSGVTNRYRCKDGTYKYIEWRSQLGTGKFSYSSGRDVTEKINLEEHLRQIATRDELTGIYNRRYFDSVILQHMEQADRYDSPLSMVIIDLDRFKLVNDKWGHPVGDTVLKQTTQVITEAIRSSDILIRFGGEEFLVLMPETTQAGATEAAEKIRDAVGKFKFSTVGKRTVSAGVAQRMRYESFIHWYKRVDQALYRAKAEGRNLVIAGEELLTSPLASMRIEWIKEWESGNSEIDSQHKELIEMGNQLIHLAMTGASHKETVQQLDKLLGSIVGHFESEEKVLLKAGYPEALAHADLHSHLVDKALWLKGAYVTGEIKSSTFFSFLVDDVILGHLMESDTKFFPYIG